MLMGADLRVAVIAELANDETVQLPRGHHILSAHSAGGRKRLGKGFDPFYSSRILGTASLLTTRLRGRVWGPSGG